MEMNEKKCSKCKKTFGCNAENSYISSSTTCWCFDLPAVEIDGTDCLCLKCLKEKNEN
tara:strand:- start:450 stop:623 length:174 start_codon:yes stop_codon:yes gene_type:complete